MLALNDGNIPASCVLPPNSLARRSGMPLGTGRGEGGIHVEWVCGGKGRGSLEHTQGAQPRRAPQRRGRHRHADRRKSDGAAVRRAGVGNTSTFTHNRGKNPQRPLGGLPPSPSTVHNIERRENRVILEGKLAHQQPKHDRSSYADKVASEAYSTAA